MAEELTVKISADSTGFKTAIGEMGKKLGEHKEQLTEISKHAAIAFAAVATEAGFAIKAYMESEQSSNALIQSMQNQGIYSKELVADYRNIATAIKEKTGIDDDEIVKAQTVLQTMLGQTKVSKELTQAVVDLSKAKGIGLAEAATIAGKAIANGTDVLKRQGIYIDDSISKEQRLIDVTDGLTASFGGQAEAQNKGLGSIKNLGVAIEDFQKAIGERLAPVVISITKKLSEMIDWFTKHDQVMDMVVALGTAAGIIAGLVTAIAGATYAIAEIQKVMTAVNIVIKALGISISGLTAATGIGLLIVVAAELYLNWGKIFPAIEELIMGFVDGISGAFSSLRDFIKGIFTIDNKKVKEDLSKTTETFDEEIERMMEIAKNAKIPAPQIERSKETDPAAQNEGLKAAADKRNAILAQAELAKRILLKAEQDLYVLQIQSATEEEISLKKAEIENIKKLTDEKYKGMRSIILEALESQKNLEEEFREDGLKRRELSQQNEIGRLQNDSNELLTNRKEQMDILKELELAYIAESQGEETEAKIEALVDHYNTLTKFEENQKIQDTLKQKQFDILKTNNQKLFNKMSETEQKLFLDTQGKNLQASILTEQGAKLQETIRKTTEQIQNNNTYLMEQQRYGTTYAEINKTMRTEEIQGLQRSFKNMEGLTASHNDTIKAIGKAAAVANITIHAAQAIMAIIAGWSTIPFVGQAIGVLEAASIVTLAGVQIANVTSAAKGGLVTGGIPGIDSIPAMLSPGELITPASNFEEVVNAVANQRTGVTESSSGKTQSVLIGFDGPAAEKTLTVRQTEAKYLGIYTGS